MDFTVDDRSLGQADAKGRRTIVPGSYVLYLGGAQPGEGAEVMSHKLTSCRGRLGYAPSTWRAPSAEERIASAIRGHKAELS